MAQERIEIKFIATGNVPLVKAIRELQKQTQKLNNQLNKLNKVNVKVAKTQALVTQRTSSNTAAVNASSTAYTRLQATISVYRNKMLLAAFATALIIRPLFKLVGMFAKFEDLERGFNSLGDSIGATSQFLQKLRDATNGTVDDMDLMRLANNAMMLGIVKSEDEMATLFDTAQRMGQALGRDAVDAIDSMVSGMGRQSKLMLDNIGIMIQMQVAYSNYALANDKAVSALDEFEKKQAFNEETLKQSQEAIAKLGDEVMSTNQALAIISVQSSKLGRELGEVLAPIVKGLSVVFKFLGDNIDAQLIKSFVGAIVLMTAAFVIHQTVLAPLIPLTIGYMMGIHKLSFALIIARIRQVKFNLAVLRNPYVAAAALLAALTYGLHQYIFALTEAEETEKKEREAKEKGNKAADENIVALKQELALLFAKTDLQKRQIEAGRELRVDEIAAINLINQRKKVLESIATQEKLDLQRQKDIMKIMSDVATMHEDSALIRLKANLALVNSEIAILEAIEESSDETEALEEHIMNLQDTAEKLNIAIQGFGKDEDGEHVLGKFGEAAENTLNTLSDFFGQYAQMSQESARGRIEDIDKTANADIESLRKSDKFRFMSDSSRAKAEKKILDKAEKDKAAARKKANKIMAIQFRIDQALNLTETIMSTKTGVMNALAMKPFPNLPLAAFIGATGAASAALIMSQKPPKMERGGFIGGRRHSQGGTLVEAEEGEFMMSRSAVQSVGLETMNRINSGSGGGAVNINFSGNVLSSDFIELEAIPQIRDAIRRGADIGVG